MARAVKRLVMRGRWLLAHLVFVAAACSREPDPRDASRTNTAPLTPAAPAPAAPAQAAAAPETPAPPRVEPDQPAAATAAPSQATTALVGPARLLLRGCRLEAELPGAEPQTREIDLPGGCVFVTTTAGAQVVKTDQGEALLVVSSQPLEARPGDCDTRVRAVVLKGNRLSVSSEQQVMRMCGAAGPFDSLLFHSLAASAKG